MDIQFDSAAGLDHLKAGLEVSQDELKKQSAQARRFNNTTLKGHPQADDVKGALKVLHPEQLLQVLHNTRTALNGTGGGSSKEQQDIPQLTAPASTAETASEVKSSSEAELSATARFTELLARITYLTNESSVQSLSAKLSAYNAMFTGVKTKFGEMANELTQKGEEYANSKGDLAKAQQQATQLQGNVDDAQTALIQAKERLTNLKEQIVKDVTVSPELQKQIDQAQTALTAAENNVSVATKALTEYKIGPLAMAITAMSQAKSDLNKVMEASQKLLASVTPVQQSAIEAQRKEQDENANSLTFLMALMSQLIDKNASEDLNAAAQLKQKLAAAAEKDAENKAKEYDDQVRKAEETQKTMGCIGKVVGWAITAVGFAAAAFTGGTSLALAAVGLALAIGDEIYQAATGNSFIQQAMEPLMKSVIQPMMQLFGEVFSSALEMFGVEKSKAELVGQIMGAITAAIAMIAGMVLAGALLSKVGGGAIGKAASKVAEATSKKMTQLMQKVISNSVRQSVKRVGDKFGRALGMNEVKLAKFVNHTEVGVVGADIVNATAQGGVNIYTSQLLVNAAESQAKMMNAAVLQDLLNKMLEQTVESFNNRIAAANAIFKNIADIAENQMQAGKYITKQMSSMAG